MLGSRVRFVTFPSVGISLVLAWTDEARRGRALNAAMYLGIHEEVPARSLVWIREYCLRSFPVCVASCLPGNGSTGEGRSDTPINVRENVERERERESLLPAILVWRELTPRVCGYRRLYFHSQCLLFCSFNHHLLHRPSSRLETRDKRRHPHTLCKQRRTLRCSTENYVTVLYIRCSGEEQQNYHENCPGVDIPSPYGRRPQTLFLKHCPWTLVSLARRCTRCSR